MTPDTTSTPRSMGIVHDLGGQSTITSCRDVMWHDIAAHIHVPGLRVQVIKRRVVGERAIRLFRGNDDGVAVLGCLGQGAFGPCAIDKVGRLLIAVGTQVERHRRKPEHVGFAR